MKRLFPLLLLQFRKVVLYLNHLQLLLLMRMTIQHSKRRHAQWLYDMILVERRHQIVNDLAEEADESEFWWRYRFCEKTCLQHQETTIQKYLRLQRFICLKSDWNIKCQISLRLLPYKFERGGPREGCQENARNFSTLNYLQVKYEQVACNLPDDGDQLETFIVGGEAELAHVHVCGKIQENKLAQQS